MPGVTTYSIRFRYLIYPSHRSVQYVHKNTGMPGNEWRAKTRSIYIYLVSIDISKIEYRKFDSSISKMKKTIAPQYERDALHGGIHINSKEIRPRNASVLLDTKIKTYLVHMYIHAYTSKRAKKQKNGREKTRTNDNYFIIIRRSTHK